MRNPVRAPLIAPQKVTGLKKLLVNVQTKDGVVSASSARHTTNDSTMKERQRRHKNNKLFLFTTTTTTTNNNYVHAPLPRVHVLWAFIIITLLLLLKKKKKWEESRIEERSKEGL